MTKHKYRNKILLRKLEDLLDHRFALRLTMVSAGRTEGGGGKPQKRESRPPINLHVLDIIKIIDKTITQIIEVVARELSLTQEDAQYNLLRYIEQIDPDSGASRYINTAIDAKMVLARRCLGYGDQFREIGFCPNKFNESQKILTDSNGNYFAELETDQCCVLDYVTSVKQTRAGDRKVEVWKRSTLLADTSADPKSSAGDVFCPVCSASWPATQWLSLRATMEGASC
jgi:hypothetical protein